MDFAKFFRLFLLLLFGQFCSSKPVCRPIAQKELAEYPYHLFKIYEGYAFLVFADKLLAFKVSRELSRLRKYNLTEVLPLCVGDRVDDYNLILSFECFADECVLSSRSGHIVVLSDEGLRDVKKLFPAIWIFEREQKRFFVGHNTVAVTDENYTKISEYRTREGVQILFPLRSYFVARKDSEILLLDEKLDVRGRLQTEAGAEVFFDSISQSFALLESTSLKIFLFPNVKVFEYEFSGTWGVKGYPDNFVWLWNRVFFTKNRKLFSVDEGGFERFVAEFNELSFDYPLKVSEHAFVVFGRDEIFVFDERGKLKRRFDYPFSECTILLSKTRLVRETVVWADGYFWFVARCMSREGCKIKLLKLGEGKFYSVELSSC